MPLETFLSPDQRYLTVLIARETPLHEFGAALQQAVKVCRETSVTRVLVDARHVRTAISRLDLFNLASSLASSGFLPGTRIAVLIDLDSPDIKYFEKVAVSRGAIIDHYLNPEEALDDLLAPIFG